MCAAVAVPFFLCCAVSGVGLVCDLSRGAGAELGLAPALTPPSQALHSTPLHSQAHNTQLSTHGGTQTRHTAHHWDAHDSAAQTPSNLSCSPRLLSSMRSASTAVADCSIRNAVVERQRCLTGSPSIALSHLDACPTILADVRSVVCRWLVETKASARHTTSSRDEQRRWSTRRQRQYVWRQTRERKGCAQAAVLF